MKKYLSAVLIIALLFLTTAPALAEPYKLTVMTDSHETITASGLEITLPAIEILRPDDYKLSALPEQGHVLTDKNGVSIEYDYPSYYLGFRTNHLNFHIITRNLAAIMEEMEQELYSDPNFIEMFSPEMLEELLITATQVYSSALNGNPEAYLKSSVWYVFEQDGYDYEWITPENLPNSTVLRYSTCNNTTSTIHYSEHVEIVHGEWNYSISLSTFEEKLIECIPGMMDTLLNTMKYSE